MAVEIGNTALLTFLRLTNIGLYSKVLELRTAIEDWLSYIPHTFPHYTRHTVGHSDGIVLQVSRLLFSDNDPGRPVVNLSAMEAYVVAAAAYLHDAGMVTSDDEKANIIASDDWKEWTSGDSPGAKRWLEIQAFRRGDIPSDKVLRDFLADVQTRFLIAEFVRRTHHLRAREFMVQNQQRLGLFALNNPILLRTIADVCVAHGLDQTELEDRERYPDRRDIEEEEVNVRFAAILLRLGDLLEMSHDRACPLLLSAACPLPSESYAHWTQYQRIVHFLTAQLRAECENQEEHRFLRDWCQWLTVEVKNASVLMSRSTRHSDWQLPRIDIDGPGATIKILPAPHATYIPSDWKFDLDIDSVFNRLINDVYIDPLSFVRELIQNALDATRCQLYLDLKRDGLEVPEYPTQVEQERRFRYPVLVGIRAIELHNPLSGEMERRHTVTVADQGIGMDREIIHRYLLQVGRSYYATPEFQRSFRFIPTSRFGLGFLSVFAVSDKVTLETYKPTSSSKDEPLRLVLTGPRNYLLLEKGTHRTAAGTQVEVLLREPLTQGDLTRAVKQWCRKVEFPIVVNDLGVETVINAERPEQFTYEIPEVTDPSAKLAVRAFDINRHGIEGELYVFVRTDSRGESWTAWNWAKYTYPSKHPQASAPLFPGSLVCLHGITVRQSPTSERCERIDYRDASKQLVLSRDFGRHVRLGGGESDIRISSRWEEILREHLATSELARGTGSWWYRQRLIDNFGFSSFWAEVPETIPTYVSGESRLNSLREVITNDLIATITSPSRRMRFLGHEVVTDLGIGASHRTEEITETEVDWPEESLAISADNIERLSSLHRKAIFSSRAVDSVKWLADGRLAIYWRKVGSAAADPKPVFSASLPDETVLAIEIHKTVDDVYKSVLLNTDNELVRWLFRLEKACSKGNCGLSPQQSERLRDMLVMAARYPGGPEMQKFANYLEGWSQLKELTSDLLPPETKISADMFFLKSHAGGK
jgi:hypothetical protein